MDTSIIFMFAGGGMLNFLCWWNATTGMIRKKELNTEKRPKYYIAPYRIIRKLFKVRRKWIPVYLNYMCYMTIIYFFLGPVEITLFYAMPDKGILAGWCFLIHYSVVIFNAVIFVILSELHN